MNLYGQDKARRCCFLGMCRLARGPVVQVPEEGGTPP